MPAPHPAPVAENIDETAARRSIRVILIIVSAALLFPMLGILVYLQFGHRPAGVQHSTSAWPVVIIVAFTVIMVVAMVLVMRRQYRRPGYRRVLQYGYRRRARVGKDLRRGKVLSAEDMPVAKALVDLVATQTRWLPALYVGLALINVLNGLTHQGSSRWLYLVSAAFILALAPLALRQRRQLIRGYARQNIPTAGDHPASVGTVR